MVYEPNSRAYGQTLPIVVPVGPGHDPRAAVESSLRSSRGDGAHPSTLHIVILNGSREPAVEPGLLVRELTSLTPDLAVAVIPADVGYVRAVRAGLGIASRLGCHADLVGFLDADALLCDLGHWSVLAKALSLNPMLDAVSGLVIHEHCEVWETPSSQRFIEAVARVVGVVEKPYIQGGAGGTLARRQVFEQAVDQALAMGTLIGPTLSATSLAAGREIRATSRLLCRHTPRRTLNEWVVSVTAYEKSWRALVREYGSDIERPWQQFLHVAEECVRTDHELARDLAHCQELRRQVVAAVEHGERLPE
ncbi:glycosyltransferase family 2 protein [Kitasatospora acidiphila]|uniref:Glycosyltransferase family 2 protein n=2 Tax=Kitasatospora acidiphila TaxID=2567942 RepID=A0A540WDR4_9ACTN|nr:glycosyltransferase family 2 protein [Kitasatospora acidiphila]